MNHKIVTLTERSHLKIVQPGAGGWLMPAIPATWEAEIRRIMVQGQPGQTAFARPYLEITQHEKGVKEWLKW
jgi:hypothetical protein